MDHVQAVNHYAFTSLLLGTARQDALPVLGFSLSPSWLVFKSWRPLISLKLLSQTANLDLPPLFWEILLALHRVNLPR